VSRLVDLIRVNDQRFLNAFYYSLRNTLVAQNLDQASRIAYGTSQRHRVVTLKGEIIEISGTMSGGGQPQRGRMGSKLVEQDISAESIKRMQEVMRNSENELREVQSRQNELDSIVEDLNAKLERSRNDVLKWTGEMQPLREQIAGLRRVEATCVKRISELAPDENVQNQLEEHVKKLTLDYEKSDQIADKVRQEVEEHHKRIVETSKNILDEPKALIKQLEKQIADANKEITNLNVESKSSKRHIANSEKKLASMKEEYEQNSSNLKRFEERLENREDEGKELSEELGKVKSECMALDKQITEMSKQNKDHEQNMQTYEAKRIDLNHALEKLNADLKSLKHELKHYDGLLKSLKLHDIDQIENGLTSNKESEKKIQIDSSDEDENNQMDTETDSPAANSEGIELRKYDNEDLTGIETDNLKRDIHKMEEDLKSQTPNLTAIQSYKELVKDEKKILN
jgi:structural maintenance of chromosome 4